MRAFLTLFFFLFFHSHSGSFFSSEAQGVFNRAITSHSKLDLVSQFVWPALSDSVEISEAEEISKRPFLVSVSYRPQISAISSFIGIPAQSKHCGDCGLFGSHPPRAPPFVA